MPYSAPQKQLFPDNLLAGLADPEGGWPEGGAPFEPGFVENRTWWVAHTKPRQEKKLAQDLEKKHTAFYLPLVPKTTMIRGRKYIAETPVFSSYLFLFGDDMERHASMTTNRIVHLMPVADSRQLTRELLDLSRLVAARAPLTVESRLKAGDRVRVKSGALAGVEGTVVARRRRCRLIVAVSLIQQGVSIEIDDHILEPI